MLEDLREHVCEPAVNMKSNELKDTKKRLDFTLQHQVHKHSKVGGKHLFYGTCKTQTRSLSFIHTVHVRLCHTKFSNHTHTLLLQLTAGCSGGGGDTWYTGPTDLKKHFFIII